MITITTINLKGPIINDSQKRIYDWLDIEATSPKDVVNNLPENGEDVELIVNSPGGLVDAGSEIYTALKEYQGSVTAKVVGMAASAASVVIMAADTVKISPTARIMIHNGWQYAEGDHRAMGSAKEALEAADKGIRNAYLSKTKISEQELTDLMNKETYMDAEKAVELGFADEIMFQESMIGIAASMGNGLLPELVVEKVRNIILKEEKQENNINNIEIMQMKNELLKEEIENSLK